jgi:hypothetical protein
MLATLVVCAAPQAQSSVATDRFWFAPDLATVDYIRLFEHPEEWEHARAVLSVFKFYQQHTEAPASSIVGSNSYDALVRAGAFRALTGWKKKIALEVASVKEQYCTPDDAGMRAASAATIASVRAVQAAGGTVAYLAMDEPFVSGRARICDGPALEPTADRVAAYTASVRGALPQVQLGLIEAYPFSPETAIETMIDLLRARSASPAFLHIDIDLAQVTRINADLAGDMRRLKAVCDSLRLPFGVIIWGNNGDADALYAADAERLLNAVTAAFPLWDTLPQHIIVQSWAESSTGLRITPTNLPEDQPYTHAGLLWDIYRRLKGGTGAATGVAIPRR